MLGGVVMNLLGRRRVLLTKLFAEQALENAEPVNILATTEVELNIQEDTSIYPTKPIVQGKSYKLSFDYEYTITENTATSFQQAFRVGSYATFQNAQIVYKGANAGVTGTFNGSYETELIATANRTVEQSVLSIESTTTILVGTYKLTNISLMEVI